MKLVFCNEADFGFCWLVWIPTDTAWGLLESFFPELRQFDELSLSLETSTIIMHIVRSCDILIEWIMNGGLFTEFGGNLEDNLLIKHDDKADIDFFAKVFIMR